MSDIIRCREFDCVECGRHIIQIVGFVGEPALCAACMTIPGWFREKKVRELLDPGHDGKEVCEKETP